jgi:hypothetical protein
MKKTLVILAVLLSLSSCKNTTDPDYTFLPKSIGPIHSVLVVMEDTLWNSALGDSIRSSFYAPIKGLSLVESRLQIQHIPPSIFTGTIKQNRTVLFAEIDSISQAYMRPDVYAAPQQVAVIKGRTTEELIYSFVDHSEEFIEAFREIELTETQERFKRSLSKDTSLEELFGVRLNMPSIYQLGKKTDDFLWFDRPVPKGTLNLIAYELPSGVFTQPNDLVGDLIFRRDAVVSDNIPGPDIPGKTTYMLTENILRPYVKAVTVSGLPAVEMRGMWEMHNYAMAGPFVSYFINDKKNDRILVLEGFVFAPNELKRNLLFELEAIIKTLEIVE